MEYITWYNERLNNIPALKNSGMGVINLIIA